MKNVNNRIKIIFFHIIFGCIIFASPAFGQAFKHPGVLNNQSELDYIKEKSLSNVQPWKKAYDVLKASNFSSLSYNSKPIPTMDCWSYNKDKNGNYVPQCKTFVEDAMAAYSTALMWYITQDKRYATKSISIINGWSNVYQSNTGSNARLNVAWAAPWFVNAAEILRHGNAGGPSGWTEADISKFTNMLNKFLPYVKDDNMPGNNWVQSAIEAQFAIAIFTDNRGEFNSAVGRWKTRVKTYIYQKSDGATPFAYPSGNVNINSSAWNGTKTFVDGLCMESCRDLGHMKLGFNSMMYAAQSAYEQGVDLFSLEQKRLSDFLELHGSWMTGAKAVPSNINGGKVIVSPNQPGIKPPTGGGQAAFEIAYNHLHARLNKNLPYTLQMINNNRPASAGQWVFKWETLTHGNLPFNINTPPPVADYTPPKGYSLAGNENDNIPVTGKVNIAYGVNGTFVYLYNQTSNIGCSNNSFGKDPASGIAKKCFVQKVETIPAVDYTPPAGYTVAANESENVTIAGKMNIAYGANGTFVYLYNQTSNVGCTNEAFGKDPISGVSKKCFVQQVATTPIVDYTPPAGYTVAANEWGNVAVTGKMNIAFGANGTFTYLYNQTSNVACSNDAFGKDPITGVSKKCFVQSVQTIPPPPTNPTANGVNGPACVETGKAYTYSVKPDNYTLTSANWWSNTNAVVTINNNQSSMSIVFPASTNGSTRTVSAGVNINVAPWYKEYTMTVKVGGCTGSSPQLRASASPQPFNMSTTVALENDEIINSVVIVNMDGMEVYRASNIEASTFVLGDNLPIGMYIAHIESAKGISIVKLVKNN